MTTISILVGTLCLLAWVRDRDFAAPTPINLREVFSPPVLALSLLPFGAIAGTHLMNSHAINALQMVLLPVIALVPVMIVCTRFVPEKYYPYAILSVAIALLCHTSLISMHVWGWDVQYEYYLTNTVVRNAVWDITAYSNCNAMLSLMTLAPTYSILLGMGLEWVFKTIYLFFFALVPLGLYVILQKQTNGKIAFLSCFFFMSIFVFYGEMLSLARQEVAELFLILIILSMIDRDLSGQQKSVLFLIFSASLVTSHYGLSYIFMFMLLLALAITVMEYNFGIQKYIAQVLNWINDKTGRLKELELQEVNFKQSIISLPLVIWYVLYLLVWYIYVASSSSFESIVVIGRRILENFSSDLLNPDAAQGMAIIVNEAATPLHEVAKYLHLLTIIFIVVGFTVTFFTRQNGVHFDIRYFLLSCGALGICIGGVTLPYFASALNTSRLYQISLILLAPFCVIGGIFIFDILNSHTRIKRPGRLNKSISPLTVFSVFLAVFFVFNSGWVYEVCNDVPTSFALNSSFDSPVFSEQEISGALWLVNFKDDRTVTADSHRRLLLYSFMGKENYRSLTKAIENMDSYIFIGRYNVLHREITMHRISGVTMVEQYTKLSDIDELLDQIYDCDITKIYSSNK